MTSTTEHGCRGRVLENEETPRPASRGVLNQTSDSVIKSLGGDSPVGVVLRVIGV